MASSLIKKVAIIGAGGNSGRYIAEALLKGGKHTVTALTRADSKSSPPEGIAIKHIDYDTPSTIVDALRGQDALVITLNPMAQKQQPTLIQAAADAGVPWVLPNEWGPCCDDPKVATDAGLGLGRIEAKDMIRKLGRSSYMAVCTGYWYAWSMSFANAYGFDFANRTVKFYDDGNVPITTSTWPQVGRSVAALLSLPADKLEQVRNKNVFVKSFNVSQKDMFESIKRATKTSDSDWKISYESSQKLWSDASERVNAGEQFARVQKMYTRFFFPAEQAGNAEKHYTIANDVLGLPEENLDEATADAVRRVGEKRGVNY